MPTYKIKLSNGEYVMNVPEESPEKAIQYYMKMMLLESFQYPFPEFYHHYHSQRLHVLCDDVPYDVSMFPDFYVGAWERVAEPRRKRDKTVEGRIITYCNCEDTFRYAFFACKDKDPIRFDVWEKSGWLRKVTGDLNDLLNVPILEFEEELGMPYHYPEEVHDEDEPESYYQYNYRIKTAKGEVFLHWVSTLPENGVDYNIY